MEYRVKFERENFNFWFVSSVWPDFYWNFLEFMCFSMRSGCVALLCFALAAADEEGLCSIFLEILEKFHASSSSGRDKKEIKDHP